MSRLIRSIRLGAFTPTLLPRSSPIALRYLATATYPVDTHQAIKPNAYEADKDYYSLKSTLDDIRAKYGIGGGRRILHPDLDQQSDLDMEHADESNVEVDKLQRMQLLLEKAARDLATLLQIARQGLNNEEDEMIARTTGVAVQHQLSSSRRDGVRRIEEEFVNPIPNKVTYTEEILEYQNQRERTIAQSVSEEYKHSSAATTPQTTDWLADMDDVSGSAVNSFRDGLMSGESLVSGDVTYNLVGESRDEENVTVASDAQPVRNDWLADADDVSGHAEEAVRSYREVMVSGDVAYSGYHLEGAEEERIDPGFKDLYSNSGSSVAAGKETASL